MWNKILVPVDFSDSSRNALKAACDLSVRWGAELTLLNVYQVPGFVYPDGFMPATPEVYQALLDQTNEALAKLRDEALRLGATKVVVKSAQGVPFEEILSEAETHDLIVIGTHGRTGLSHVFLGSVAEHVVRLAHCAVLTLRMPKADANKASEQGAAAPL